MRNKIHPPLHLSGLCCALVAHFRYKRRKNSSPGFVGIGVGGGRSKKRNATAVLVPGGKKQQQRILKLISPPRAQRSLPLSPQHQQQHYQHRRQEQPMLTAVGEFAGPLTQQQAAEAGGTEQRLADICGWRNGWETFLDFRKKKSKSFCFYPRFFYILFWFKTLSKLKGRTFTGLNQSGISSMRSNNNK